MGCEEVSHTKDNRKYERLLSKTWLFQYFWENLLNSIPYLPSREDEKKHPPRRRRRRRERRKSNQKVSTFFKLPYNLRVFLTKTLINLWSILLAFGWVWAVPLLSPCLSRVILCLLLLFFLLLLLLMACLWQLRQRILSHKLNPTKALSAHSAVTVAIWRLRIPASSDAISPATTMKN